MDSTLFTSDDLNSDTVDYHVDTEGSYLAAWITNRVRHGYVPIGGVGTFKTRGVVHFYIYMIKQRGRK